MSDVKSFMIVLMFTLAFNTIILLYAQETKASIICGMDYDDDYELQNLTLEEIANINNVTYSGGQEEIIKQALDNQCQQLPLWIWIINAGCTVVLFYWGRKFIGFS